jgi:ankyrin repeat protein
MSLSEAAILLWHTLEHDKQEDDDEATVRQLLQQWPALASQKLAGEWLPLHYAARYRGGQPGAAIVKLLLQANPAAATVRGAAGWLPLHVAAECPGGGNGTAVLEVLLQAKPEAALMANDSGWLPLHVAAQYQGGDKGAAVSRLGMSYAALILPLGGGYAAQVQARSGQGA